VGVGKNGEGELGIGTLVDSNVPVEVTGVCAIASGVAEAEEGGSITVFPNPTTGKFTVEGLDMSRTASLEVRNVMGEEVMRSDITGVSSEIDLSSQPDGIYFMTIMTADEIISQRVIKE
jgi:hypothetical protein